MIVPYLSSDFQLVLNVINYAALAYKGIIPGDRWKDPYMTDEELQNQLKQGIRFWCYRDGQQILGVMGIQYKGEVTLIRHAYVHPDCQHRGIGSDLLSHLTSLTDGPILIGTWADAAWAIHFYEKHGYRLLSPAESSRVLQRYWNIPQRQVETSVVLANERWKG